MKLQKQVRTPKSHIKTTAPKQIPAREHRKMKSISWSWKVAQFVWSETLTSGSQTTGVPYTNHIIHHSEWLHIQPNPAFLTVFS